MRVSYDLETDTLVVTLREDARIEVSDEHRPGLILDYDKDDNVVALEILDASERVSGADKVEFGLGD